jgi:hypothetical protein
MVILDPNFFDPGLRIRIFFHPGSRIRIKEFKYFNPKIVCKPSEIRSGLFIPDLDLGSGFFTHPGSSGPKDTAEGFEKYRPLTCCVDPPQRLPPSPAAG